MKQMEDLAGAGWSVLTARERDVIYPVAEGKSNKLIAMELGISMRTVEAHRARIFYKMGVRNAVQLARTVCQHPDPASSFEPGVASESSQAGEARKPGETAQPGSSSRADHSHHADHADHMDRMDHMDHTDHTDRRHQMHGTGQTDRISQINLKDQVELSGAK